MNLLNVLMAVLLAGMSLTTFCSDASAMGGGRDDHSGEQGAFFGAHHGHGNGHDSHGNGNGYGHDHGGENGGGGAPEPATMFLLAAGASAVGLKYVRRKKNTSESQQ